MNKVRASKTRVIFWAFAVPFRRRARTVRYGGNTSCVEVRADGEIIILDAGSGIRLLGQSLQREFGSRSNRLAILIRIPTGITSRAALFPPAYSGKNQLRVFGYDGTRTRLGEILAGQMETPFFPVTMAELPGKIEIEELKEMDFQIGRLRIRSKFLNHPGVCAGYRIYTPAGSVVYMPDNEPFEQLDVQLRIAALKIPRANSNRLRKSARI